MFALAEEERDTCPACGMLKIICRDPKNKYGVFEVREDFCWATYRIASHTGCDNWKARHEDTRRATQLAVTFREGQAPPLEIGLDLPDSGDVEVDEL